MRIRPVIPAALVVVFALSGCAQPAPAETPAPTVTAQANPTILNPALVPKPLFVATADNTAVEGTRLGDEFEAIIDPSVIINISDASQLVPADDDIAPYYAVYRTYTLDPSVDPLTLAGVIVSALVQSDWELRGSGNKGGVYSAQLSGGTRQEPWFTIVDGDASTAGQSVLIVRIASPDITG